MSAGVVEQQDSLIGRVIQGRFKVLDRLAAGGMGVVYRAEQQPLGRTVAFKILDTKATPSADGSFAKRFLLEASAAAKLGHPNTIVVHDYGQTDDGLFFIAMEYLDGGTLGKWLKDRGPLSPTDAIHVSLQIVSSLRDAHQNGLVHRDLKPGNVMFAPRGGDPLFVKVLDFGLVKLVGETDLQLTQSGMMMGSPRYMAPEQVKAQPADSRTDIYSFGAVLYHMLVGCPPFASGSAFEAMNHHVYTPAPPLRSVWPGCPVGPQLEAVVQRCLQKDQAHRFQSMDELMTALRGCVAEAGGAMMAGSYLSVGHNPGDSASYPGAPAMAHSYPQLAASNPYPQHVPSAPGSDSNPSISQSGVSPSRVGPPTNETYQRTVMFTASQAPPPPSPSYPEHTRAPATASMSTEKRSSPVLTFILAALLVLLAGGVVAAAVLFIPFDDPTLPNIATADAPRDHIVVSPIEEEVEAPTETPEAPADPVTPIAAEEVAPSNDGDIQAITLNTSPQGAAVRRDGADLGDTPLPLLIPRGERWTIEVLLEGHEPRTVTVASGGQPSMTLNLTPTRHAPVVRHHPRIQPRIQQYPVAPPPVIRRPPPVVRQGGGRQVYAPDLDDPWHHR